MLCSKHGFWDGEKKKTVLLQLLKMQLQGEWGEVEKASCFNME